MSRLALHGEVDAIGGLGLDLEVGCSQSIVSCTSQLIPRCEIIPQSRKHTSARVIEVLVQELFHFSVISIRLSTRLN